MSFFESFHSSPTPMLGNPYVKSGLSTNHTGRLVGFSTGRLKDLSVSASGGLQDDHILMWGQCLDITSKSEACNAQRILSMRMHVSMNIYDMFLKCTYDILWET